MKEKLRAFWQWWIGLYPPIRNLMVLVPLVIIALVLFFALRAPADEAPSGAVIPTPYTQLNSFPVSTGTGLPAAMLDDGRFFYEPGWGAAEINAFLSGRPGVLGGWHSWAGDQEVPFGNLVAGYSLLYGVNPKVVLALLEVQSGLIDDPAPTPETLDWAMGYRADDMRGIEAQLHWAVRELFRGTRDYPSGALVLHEGETVAVPAGANLAGFSLLRTVGMTGDATALQQFQGNGDTSFVQVYRRLFGEDPRLPLERLPAPANSPLFTQPYVGVYEVTSIFDHQGPFLKADGSLLSHLGLLSPGLPYDGHDGWDYALDTGVPILAAASGRVVWSGNLNDGCATISRGVILDHGNGYQTIYWHLSQVDVAIGAEVAHGEQLGLAGATGCADGPHLHFGVHFIGRETDPAGWCGREPDPWASHPAGTVSTWLWADRFSPCQLPSGAVLVDDLSPDCQRSGVNWQQDQGGGWRRGALGHFGTTQWSRACW